MPRIIVSPLRRVPELHAAHTPSHVVSLLGPDTDPPVLETVAPGNHLHLVLHDISELMDGHVPPSTHHVEDLLEFFTLWKRDQPMLIHCWAGISRSTAAAYAAMCMMRPGDDERILARMLREASPTATPNRLIVAHADRLLDRGGRMIEAIAEIGRGEHAWEGAVFTLGFDEPAEL